MIHTTSSLIRVATCNGNSRSSKEIFCMTELEYWDFGGEMKNSRLSMVIL